MSPLSNSFLRADQLNAAEIFFPLRTHVCHKCFLVQLQEYECPEAIFSDYLYFSSYSESWLQHAQEFAIWAKDQFNLGEQSLVVEIASNDGYLLQYFRAMGIPVLGIEPAANVATVAEEKGIPTIVRFFGAALAEEFTATGQKASMIVGNNVLAHVPSLNDFVAGMKLLLADDGIISMEFPHLLQLVEQNQFDTIYHEHFSYLSLHAVERIFSTHGLRIFDVSELTTHGGSLRILATHNYNSRYPARTSVGALRSREGHAGLLSLSAYASFSEKVRRVKRELLAFLIDAKNSEKSIAAYGAAAKGNTLLNFCGIGTDFIDFVADVSPHKQGMFLPGTHIPIVSPQKVFDTKPHYLLILPWNLRKEVIEQMSSIRNWGGKFIIPIPKLEIV